MDNNKDLLKVFILWLTSLQAEELSEKDNIPNYILNEIKSRAGRAGRNKLWCSSEIKLEDSLWDTQNNGICQVLHNDKYGGIVIFKDDIKHFIGMNIPYTDATYTFLKSS